MQLSHFFHVVFLGVGVLSAQISPTPAPEMAWKGDDVIVREPDRFVVNTSKNGPAKGVRRTIHLPPKSVDAHWVHDWFWTIQWDSADSRYLISRSDGVEGWETVAVLEQPGAKASRFFRIQAIPLSEERFLLVDYARKFKIGHQSFPMVVARKDQKGRLQVERELDLGIKGHLSSTWLASMLVGRSPFLIAGDKVFLWSDRIGRFWEISPGGSVRREIRLFNGLDDERIADIEGFDWAVICAQPTKDGDILVASFAEEMVLNGQKLIPRVYTKETVFGGKSQETETRDLKALKAFPGIAWWRVDTTTGKVSPAPPPRNVPTQLQTTQQVRSFGFLFNPDGNLVFPDWKE